jgi:hypothetical protein
LERAAPDHDFLIPERYREFANSSTHVEVPAEPGYFFLLSAAKQNAGGSNHRTCRM